MDPEYKAILKRLQELPELITSKEREILKLKNDEIEAIYFRNKRQGYLEYLVASEIDDKGKKKHSNEAARRKESTYKLEKDNEFKKLKADAEMITLNKSNEEIALKKYLLEFSSIKYQIKVLYLARKLVE